MTNQPKKRKKSLVGWTGKRWLQYWKLTPKSQCYGDDASVSRYKIDVDDIKVRITIEEL